MEPLITFQQQMEPPEHFSEERTLLERGWGVLSAEWRWDEGSFTEHHGPWHR